MNFVPIHLPDRDFVGRRPAGQLSSPQIVIKSHLLPTFSHWSCRWPGRCCEKRGIQLPRVLPHVSSTFPRTFTFLYSFSTSEKLVLSSSASGDSNRPFRIASKLCLNASSTSHLFPGDWDALFPKQLISYFDRALILIGREEGVFQVRTCSIYSSDFLYRSSKYITS